MQLCSASIGLVDRSVFPASTEQHDNMIHEQGLQAMLSSWSWGNEGDRFAERANPTPSPIHIARWAG
jgi:hypothetical protein